MTAVSSRTQLNTFDSLKTILLADTLLSTKFGTRDFYEFLPLVKSPSFNGYPFFVLEIPQDEDNQQFLGNTGNYEKTFTVSIDMYNEWEARSNVKSYAAAVINAIENANATLQASGYYLETVNIEVPPEVDILDQKQVVVTNFAVTLRGVVI